jgi:hypothetical protein
MRPQGRFLCVDISERALYFAHAQHARGENAMYYWVIALLIVVGLMILFWGSGQGPFGMRIILFGLFTVYEEKQRFWSLDEILDLVRKEIVRCHEQEKNSEVGGDDEHDDKNRRFPDSDLWDHFEAAGFAVIDDARGPRLADVGKIDWEDTDGVCHRCDRDIVVLWEICTGPEQDGGVVGSVDPNLLGRVCTSCGQRKLADNESTRPVGVIGPVIGKNPNFFDVLEYFVQLRKPKNGPDRSTPEAVATAPLETDQASEPTEQPGENGVS